MLIVTSNTLIQYHETTKPYPNEHDLILEQSES